VTSSLAQRIFHAHLELSYRLGRRVTLAEFGALIAEEMGRSEGFTAAAVSRWEKGVQIPSPRIIEAIAAVTQLDPGWISHGEKTRAPAPVRLAQPALPSEPTTAGREVPVADPQPAQGDRIARRRT
jgi:transcriptional regulator with XRE-family HTH domain